MIDSLLDSGKREARRLLEIKAVSHLLSFSLLPLMTIVNRDSLVEEYNTWYATFRINNYHWRNSRKLGEKKCARCCLHIGIPQRSKPPFDSLRSLPLLPFLPGCSKARGQPECLSFFFLFLNLSF